MFKTIIWATDGSETADKALAVAEEIADVHGSKLVAVHVTRVFEGGRYNGGTLFADDDDLRRKIRTQVDQLRSRGVDASLVLRTSAYEDAPHLICETAVERGADLIVVGTHGRGAIPSALFGGVAKQLGHIAACPVLIVPPAVQPSGIDKTGAGSRARHVVRTPSQGVSSL